MSEFGESRPENLPLQAPQKSWAQRDAEITGAITSLARALFGLIAIALGLVLVIGTYSQVWKIAKHGVFQDTEAVYSWLLFSLLAGALIAFGLGQGVALFWIGRDADHDARLWAGTGSKDRGILIEKRGKATNVTSMFWLSLTLVLLVTQEIILFRPITASLSSFRWEAFMALFVTMSFAWLLWLSVKHSGRGEKFGNQQSKVWVSKNAWTIHSSGTTLGAAIFFGLTGFIALAFAIYDLVIHPVTWLGVFGLMPGIFFLAIPCTSVVEIRENMRNGPSKLNLFRNIAGRQFIYSGTVEVSKQNDLQNGKWHGVIEASDDDNQCIRELGTEFCLAASEGKKQRQNLSFKFLLTPPTAMPYNGGAATWTMTVFHSKSPEKKTVFCLPKDVLFLEEIPSRQ